VGIATWHALCMNAGDHVRLATFWAEALGFDAKPWGRGNFRLSGDSPPVVLWIDPVPEAKTVKHRAHLDVDVAEVDHLRALGATVLRPPTEEDEWWVMADPEGGEFCAFLRDGAVPARLRAVVVDSADPISQRAWWGEVLGLSPEPEPAEHYAALDGRGVLPFDFLCFVPVPEPKRVKNRIHWDVRAAGIAPLIERGASVLREPDDDISWHVMADPEGNEFCVFT
jgi:hypothetical protein